MYVMCMCVYCMDFYVRVVSVCVCVCVRTMSFGHIAHAQFPVLMNLVARRQMDAPSLTVLTLLVLHVCVSSLPTRHHEAEGYAQQGGKFYSCNR